MIYIENNFLDLDYFENLKNFSKSNNIKYSPRYMDPLREKNDENTYGFRQDLNEKNELCVILRNTCLKKFKFKIEKGYCGLDKRQLTMYKPHTDIAMYNLYLMIEGGSELNHGIGFYDNNQLNIHIGFQENRAVFFNSNILHSPLVDSKIWRTTLTYFIHEGFFK
jgi:hypothetical protein